MDFTSPSAFCALAITSLASCALAFPVRQARPIASTANFFTSISFRLTFGIWSDGIRSGAATAAASAARRFRKRDGERDELSRGPSSDRHHDELPVLVHVGHRHGRL